MPGALLGIGTSPTCGVAGFEIWWARSLLTGRRSSICNSARLFASRRREISNGLSFPRTAASDSWIQSGGVAKPGSFTVFPLRLPGIASNTARQSYRTIVTASSSGAASQKTENNQLHFPVIGSPTIRAVKRLLYSSVLAVTLAGCAENQITGRRQLLLVSESQAISESAVAYNSMMGDFGKKKQVEVGTARAAKVHEITNRLIAQAVRYRPDSANWKWEVQVINDPKTVNAFCMAGGKMAIYTGMWEKVHATDDEIAEVMGHEISHALLNHTQERMSVALSSQIGLAAAAIVLAPRDSTGLALTGAAAAAALAIQLPNSRESESEADQVGLELAARAGYDPAAAVTLWDKMSKLGGQPPEFMSTHPSPEHRSARLKELGAKLEPVYLSAKNTSPPAQQYLK